MWLKNIKKKFNIQSTEQKLIVSEECVIILKFINEKQKKWNERADVEYQKDKDNFDKKQNTCSACGSTKVVNKIIQKIKTSTNYPRFVFQQPTKYSYSVDDEIRHCSDCGNEWYKRKWYESYLYKKRTPDFKSFIIKKEHMLKGYQEINKLHAESLYKAFDKEIPLDRLRCDFKSIFEIRV